MEETKKKKIHRIAVLVFSIILAAYAMFAWCHANHEWSTSICKSIKVTIEDSTDIQFIRESDVKDAMRSLFEEDFTGNNLKAINTTVIERKLKKHLSAVEEIKCFKSANSDLCINIKQRQPVLRVLTGNESYYVDSNGKKLPMPKTLDPVHVLVASGNIDENLATGELYDFAMLIREDKFWNAQIEQVFINNRKEAILTPRVGNHIVEFGKLEDDNVTKVKLGHLNKLYTKALPHQGWETYSKISLKYNNQIVCTKRK
ncbi:MAG: hypothetical protein KBT32_09600 [Bacteroidales bacterium]|nr:hypothetical protein [Candidatus Physcocola equi]